jgi:hypothetical protein
MMPARIKVLVDDPSKCETKIALIQCIQPRDERRMYRLGDTTNISTRRSPPIASSRTRRPPPGRAASAPSRCRASTGAATRAMRRSGLGALQQITDPATACKARLDYVSVAKTKTARGTAP